MAPADSSASLAPGFRFHPTDEELVRYYLKRKVTNKPFRFDAISVIDIYKSEPWDLPGKSRLKSRDLEWYFFSVLDRKYGNGSKTNRATEKGYWKTTGKDRAIKCNSKTIGMKKTLVYHRGRAPRGERTNWVMHEYRLLDEQLEKDGIAQDAFVVCRVFQKSGPGPKNGEQYGAPFVEEEWEDDEVVALLPGGEMGSVAEEVIVGHDAYVEANDLGQNFDTEITSENTPLPLNYHHGESSNYVEEPVNFSDDQKPSIGGDETQCGFDLPDDQNLYRLSEKYQMDVKSIKDECVADPSNIVNAADVNYLLDEPYMDPPFNEGLFLEANDLSSPVEPDTTGDSTGFDMVDEYLNFFDANDENLTFDLSEIMGSENAVSDQELVSEKDMHEGNEELSKESQKLLETNIVSDASSSKQKSDDMKFESDFKYPFLKQASHMLGGIPAPPSFASEFPAKEVALRLNMAEASSSIHFTAGIIRIENMALGGNGIDWSFGKNGNVNIVLSFGLSHDASPASLEPVSNLFLGKAGSVVSRGWLFLMFFWVLILSVSYKVGTYVCAK